jgi:SRSO17 transposase
MLPKMRSDEYLFEVPKFNLKPTDVEGFEDRLMEFHAEFADCFLRSESRTNFLYYMSGQFSQCERKSIEPIALKIEGADVRPLQRFVSDAPWDEKKIEYKYRGMVAESMGSSDGVLIFDETGVPKKGDESAGVARQYCGRSGKVDNCQVGVFAAYASQRGYALVGKSLYVPEKWFEPDFAVRRKKCSMPPDLTFKTKPQLAADMLNTITEEGLLPFRYVTTDTVYGDNPGFRSAVSRIEGCIFMLAVSRTTRCRLDEPLPHMKSYRYAGSTRTKVVVDTSSLSVEEIARNTKPLSWYRREVMEGTKGPTVYEFARKRIRLSAGAQEGAEEVWLLMRRSIDQEPTYSYFISNAPAQTALSTFVWLSGMRWPIEQCFEECKTELGMAQYEVRKYTGWNHHMLTCMLGHYFLWHLKLTLGKKSTSTYGVAA